MSILIFEIDDLELEDDFVFVFDEGELVINDKIIDDNERFVFY